MRSVDLGYAYWPRRLAWGLLAVGGFHLVEHVMQTYQAYVLEVTPANGLLGRWVDRDWIHLAYNATFLAFLVPIARLGGQRFSLRWQLFLGGVVAGSYHVVEHSVKTYQAMVLGHSPALGIAGNFGPLIPVHLWLNLVVFVLVAPHLIQLAHGPTARQTPVGHPSGIA